MIQSMTAYGIGQSESDQGSLTIELRGVNSRFLDIHLRVPEELRFLETNIRELISSKLTRGKVDVRMNYARSNADQQININDEYLQTLAKQLHRVRTFILDTPTPGLYEIIEKQGSSQVSLDTKKWFEMCTQAGNQAIEQLAEARKREGSRLATAMLECSTQMAAILEETEKSLPEINQLYQEKIVERLRETLNAVSPEGYAQISGSELSARIAQEASLFALRGDVAEEITRLRSHLEELNYLLGDKSSADGTTARKSKGSTGKRLDFLCQEMNREANTLGSKASGLNITTAAIDLKLLIEQLREQAQNIE